MKDTVSTTKLTNDNTKSTVVNLKDALQLIGLKELTANIYSFPETRKTKLAH